MKIKLRRILPLVVLLAVSLAMAGPAAAAVEKVTKSGEGGWAANITSADGEVVFQDGPETPPLGTGSVRLFTGTHGDEAAAIRNSGYEGVRLADIQKLSYSTYVTQWNGVENGGQNGGQAPYIILSVSSDGSGTVDHLLFFEPEYQNGYTTNVATQDDLTLKTWQTWDAIDSTDTTKGGWYEVSGSFAGPGGSVLPLSDYIDATAYPDATIENTSTGLGGFRIVSGFASPTDVFDANVDNVTLNTSAASTTYDFEAPLGTPGDDNITGTDGPDEINSGAGNDTVNAGAGNDSVNSGSGNDTVNGGPGNDTIAGGSGRDTLTGGSGRDTIKGGPGGDTIRAADGEKDFITCGKGKDRVSADKKDVVRGACERVNRR